MTEQDQTLAEQANADETATTETVVVIEESTDSAPADETAVEDAPDSDGDGVEDESTASEDADGVEPETL